MINLTRIFKTSLLLILLCLCSADAQNLFYGPESVVFDNADNRYLVANYRNGAIIQVDSTGAQDYFKVGLGHCLGMHIIGDTLFVSCNYNFRAFLLPDGDSLFCLTASLSGHFDGVTSDTSGNLYVIDTGGRILKLNLEDLSFSVLIESGLPGYPQDCVFDPENNRLLVATWANNAPIYAVDLENSILYTVVPTNFGMFDGITRDASGNVYVSSHYGAGLIYRFERTFGEPPQLISSGHNQPAGLFYNNRDDVLAVPNYGSSTVDFISIDTPIAETEITVPDKYFLFQNYPNPFNLTTSISYELPSSDFITINILYILGRKVLTLVDEKQSAGFHEIWWSANNQPSGVYFYSIQAGKNREIRKMLLLK
jgi:DNA-binding beta-propeller fold protein YncE